MMEYPKLITPVEGREYRNRNGDVYRCLQVIDPEHAVMERRSDSWTLTACCTRQYGDGTIEWDGSINCYWPPKEKGV